MSDDQTLALLLRQTMLANDDGLLEFLTEKWGSIVIFVPKLARSKKKAEIDFFRLIDLQVFQGRQSKKLKGVTTHTLFPGCTQSYDATQQAFAWLDLLKKNFPEEKPLPPGLFQQITEIFLHYNEDEALLLDVFLRLKLLDAAGLISRFDQVRGDAYFDPIKGQFFDQATPATIFLPNLTRQMLEFLRRSDLKTILEKQSKLPLDDLPQVQALLEQVGEYHS